MNRTVAVTGANGQVGLALLLMLIVTVTYHDILRFFKG